MKVLMISKALVGGAYHKKLEELAALGVDLHLIVPPEWGGQRLEISEAKKYHIHVVPIMLSGRNHFHVYRRIRPLFRQIMPDIVHIDEEHYSIVTLQAMMLARNVRARTLFFTWQNIRKSYPVPFSWIEQYNFRSADAAIAGNHEAAEILRKKGFGKPISEIPQFGVDPQIFAKRDAVAHRVLLGIRPDEFVVGYMGRMVAEKGLATLLDAFEELPQRVRLLMIGGGPYKADLVKKAADLGIPDRLLWIETVPSMEVPLYLNCFDCLVLPSLTRSNWKEQFGRVLIEAMSCEVPVVGSSSGEIPHVISDAGLVFPEGDAGKLAALLARIIENDSLKRDLGKKGRERVVAHYTQKKIAFDTFAVYQAILR